ncbi:MAG: RpiB/LacA/LacB family sugar-phosphate isomerase [Candidatus Paceibacterota bacterium]|jgi:ribose 5-phosphate isomerase B
MKLYIASDHAGYDLKETLKNYLGELKYELEDFGPFVFDANDDYPDFIKLAAGAVSRNLEGSMGIVLGGGGQGEAIVCNRFKGVRAAVFYGPRQAVSRVDISGRESIDVYEQIRLAREHNDANILSLAARFVTPEEAKEAVKIFLDTKFSGDERHARRIKKIDEVK